MLRWRGLVGPGVRTEGEAAELTNKEQKTKAEADLKKIQVATAALRLTSRYRITILDKGVGYGLRLYLFNSGQMKDSIAGRLTYEPGTPGAWHVFAGCERAYADQICAEQKVEVKNGTRIIYEWQKISSHAQNHFLDCETNNTLAAEILGVRYLQKVSAMQTQSDLQVPEDNTW